MGNALSHRIPALATACMSTAALVFSTLSGTSCSFLEIKARSGLLLLSADEIQLTVSFAHLGVLCDKGYYDREGDQMWELSRIFLIIAIVLGSISTALAWAVTTFLPPTVYNWKLLSTLSSLTAVVQVPIFLLFESHACAHFVSRQYCTLDYASYLLIGSTICWVSVVFLTQCMDPPLWAIELSAWKVQKRRSSRRIPNTDPDIIDHDDNFDDARISRGYESTPKVAKQSELTKKKTYKQNKSFASSTSQLPWWSRTRSTVDPIKERLVVKKESKENSQLVIKRSFEYDSSKSRPFFRVLIDGKPDASRQDDQAQSADSFDNPDDIFQLAEKGQLPESYSEPSSPLRKHDDAKHFIEPAGFVSNQSTRFMNDDTNFTIVGEYPPEVSKSPGEDINKQSLFSAALTKKGSSVELLQLPADDSQTQPPADGSIVSDDVADHNIKTNNMQATIEGAASPQQILSDLAGSEDKSDLNGLALFKQEADDIVAKSAKFNSNVRTFKKKISKSTKKRRRKLRRQVKNGYALIDDEDDDDYETAYSSPPIEVRIGATDRKAAEPRVYSTTDEKLMDDWNALHAATMAGAATAVKENTQSPDPPGQPVATFNTEDSQFVENDGKSLPGSGSDVSPLQLRDEVANFSDVSYSDPEPVYYSSDDTRSEVSMSSLERFVPKQDKDEDNDSAASGASGSSGSRSGRRSSRGRRRRRRRGNASVCSIRSARSLMDLTIDEETDQDILNEEAGLDAYEFKRTLSAPEHGGIRLRNGVQLGFRGRGRSMVDKHYRPLVEKENVSSAGNRRGRSMSIPRSNKKAQSRISLSPSRVRNAQARLWKEQRDGGMHATVVSDDSSNSSSSQSFRSNRSERARQARIRRLQRHPVSKPETNVEILELLPSGSAEDSSNIAESAQEGHLGPDAKALRVRSKHSGDALVGQVKDPLADEELSDLSYNELMIDSLDLQLIECRRPEGAEYGDDEASL